MQSKEVKELKEYAGKLWDEPTISDPGDVINKLLTMIDKIPAQSPAASKDERTYIIHLSDKVNSILVAALRELNEEQMICLRDSLIERTPPSKDVEDGWIDVKDKLPAENKWFIVNSSTRDVTMMFYDGNNQWLPLYEEENYSEKVTHWQELPPPPQWAEQVKEDKPVG